jgi:hypothetical protein
VIGITIALAILSAVAWACWIGPVLSKSDELDEIQKGLINQPQP